jgi:hypothetical protein
MLPNTTCTTTQKPNSVEIYNQIETKFSWIRTLYRGSDDENTRLIAYLANEQKLELAIYLTRGDGGQNLIEQLRELLGVIRTQELIEARKIDGGAIFSRANDFGFLKPNRDIRNLG